MGDSVSAQSAAPGAFSSRLWKPFNIAEKVICGAAFCLLTLIPFSEAVAHLFKTGIPASTSLIKCALFVSALIAGMLTARSGEHITIAVMHFVSNQKAKRVFKGISGSISLLIITVIFWGALSFYMTSLAVDQFIPMRVVGVLLPLGFAVIGFRFARALPLRGAAWLLPIAVFLVGTFFALPSVARLFQEAPPWLDALNQGIIRLVERFQGPFAVFLILSAFIGTPLFSVIAGIALVVIQASGGGAEDISIQTYAVLTTDSFVAIPLFTLTGFFLSESRASERLVRAFRGLFNWFPGGMIIATVVICAFFTSFTGASGVTILALGAILFSILSKNFSYPEKFSVGLLTSVGGIGILFPPSLPIILVGVRSTTNIVHVFLGALLPGAILVAAMIIFGIIASVKVKIPTERFNVKNAALAVRDSLWEILLPFLLIAGYFTGLLSLVEMGAVSVVYIFVIEVLVHRDIPFRDIPKVLFKAVPVIGGVLIILAAASALSDSITMAAIPDTFADWMKRTIESPLVFLLLLNLALLLVGCIMDIFSAILVILPLIVPLGQRYGIDPVHLCVIFLVNLEVGFLTPPVGLNLFLASSRFEMPFTKICRYVLPFLLIQLLVVLLVTYIPALSTTLPALFARLGG
ncbi:MAG: TRAP transporter large permease subunit [Treponema sp.]|jgi:tripartite ATP-independent transporter DctM subunit|nr:TRAP transporter large permease subunit [Treponema sp.]